jgi:signal transduction histidine kinase
MDIINTCIETTKDYHSVAYYSHLVPVAIALLLALVVLIKSNYSLLSKTFFVFTISFCTWLVGDVFIWTSSDYDLISAVWAPLDYINILFYVLGAYFFSVFLKGKDVSLWQKILLLAITLPAWIITYTGASITAFYQPYCEAYNSEWLTTYKLIIEVVVVIYIITASLLTWKKSSTTKRKQIVAISLALILFFATFSITEYISSVTGVYEINLYSLFVLPIFLIVILYSIVNLKIFDLKLFGVRLLACSFLILVAFQFLFFQNKTDKLLTATTFILSTIFVYLLLSNVRREIEAKELIGKQKVLLEKANDRLKILDKQKTEFVSLASHQLRAPMTAIKGYGSMILDGDYGAVPEQMKEPIHHIFSSTQSLIQIVGDFLDVTRIELGTMKFSFSDFDFKDLVKDVVGELSPNIDKSRLEFKFEAPDEPMPFHGDSAKIKQVLNNIIDNAIKYTKHGWVHAKLEKNGSTYRFSVSDTGVGIHPETLPKLFEKFIRAGNANEANVIGTGLGLYVAKQMIQKHNGRIWAESEGEGKGSTFVVEVEGR